MADDTDKIKIETAVDKKDENAEQGEKSDSSPKNSTESEKLPAAKEKKKVAKGPVILLADDDELILQMYKKKLESEGYNIKTASTGYDAISVAEEEQPTIIISDFVMPDMNGIEVLHALKKKDETKDIPVIILTNFSDKEEDIKAAKDAGAYDYLIKAQTSPVDLSERIKQFLETKK